MSDNEQTSDAASNIQMLLDSIAVGRIEVAEYCQGISASQLTEKIARSSNVTAATILRSLTHHELNWLNHLDDPPSPSTVRQSEQASHDIADGPDVLALWQASCERSQKAAEHLTTQGSYEGVTDGMLCAALLPLFSAYAAQTAKLRLLIKME